MKAKAKPKRRHITANSITLLDSTGKQRIILNAGGDDGYAVIGLYANDGKSVQISSDPDGAVQLAVFGKQCRSHISIHIGADEAGHISISNSDGKPGTIIGEEPKTGIHRLVLFKKGQHFWSTPSGKKSKT